VVDLVVQDKQDGTGFDATLTNPVGSALLYLASFGGDLRSMVFSTVAATPVTATIDVAATVGAYFVYAMDDDGATPVQVFRVTDSSLGLHADCLNAVRDFIMGLALGSYPANGDAHKRHKLPKRTIKEFGQPPHGVHYWMLPERRTQSDNVRQRVTYPIEVVLIKQNDGSNLLDVEWTKSRELIGRSFTACPLPAVPDVHTVEVVPGAVYADRALQLNMDLQSMTFLCMTEQISVFM